MKSGIIRRIDDLGRVIIPKDIRRNLNLNENDMLEFSVESEKICMTKYSAEDDCGDTEYCPLLNVGDTVYDISYQTTGNGIVAFKIVKIESNKDSACYHIETDNGLMKDTIYSADFGKTVFLTQKGAMKALEWKQKRTEQPQEIEVWNGQYCCPVCDTLYGNVNDVDDLKKIGKWKMPHCKRCGQALDWKGDNQNG